MLLEALKNAATGARGSPLNNTRTSWYSELVIYLVKEKKMPNLIKYVKEFSNNSNFLKMYIIKSDGLL